MKLSFRNLGSLYLFVLLLTVLYVIPASLLVILLAVLCLQDVTLSMYFKKSYTFLQPILLIIYTCYYPRLIVLEVEPTFFLYGNLQNYGRLTFDVAVYLYCLTTLFILSLCIPFELIRGKKLNPYVKFAAKLRLPTFLIFFSTVYLILVLAFGLFVKKSGDTALLKLLLPLELLLPLGVTAIFYGGRMQKLVGITAVGVTFIAILFRGSKAGIFLSILYFFAVYCLQSEKQSKISVVRLMLVAAVLVAIVFYAINIANEIRFGGALLLPAVYQTSELPPIVYFLIDRVTQRFNGADGLIIMILHDTPLKYTLSDALQSGIAKLVPGVSYTGYSMGQYIGINMVGIGEGYGGALGIFGASILLLKNAAPFFIMLCGAFIAWMLKIVSTANDGFEKTFVYLLLVYLSGLYIISGNVDVMLQFTVTLIFQIILYIMLIAKIRFRHVP